MANGFLGRIKRIGQDIKENRGVYIGAVKDAASGVVNTVGDVVEGAKAKREENIKKNRAERLEKCPNCGGALDEAQSLDETLFHVCENQDKCPTVLDDDGREDSSKQLKDGLIVDVEPAPESADKKDNSSKKDEEVKTDHSGEKGSPK